MKRYFTRLSDYALTISAIKEEMREQEITETEATEAIPFKDPNFIWCNEYYEMGERGGCGKICDKYAPKNGKSGCCKHLGQLNEEGEKLIIKI